MSLFSEDTLKQSQATPYSQYLIEVEQFKVNMIRPEIPPISEKFEKDELAKREGLEWLGGVECHLYLPDSSGIEGQKTKLHSLLEDLKSRAVHLPEGFCASFPEGYDESLIALDLETTGLDTRVLYDSKGVLDPKIALVGVCLAVSGIEGYYLPVKHTEEDGNPNWGHDTIIAFLDEVHQQFAVIYHNAQYDREAAAIFGVTQFRPFPYFFDTLLLDFLTDVNRKQHRLKVIAKLHLGRMMLEIYQLFLIDGEIKAKEARGFIQFDTISASIALVYGCSDAMNTFALFQFFAAQPEEKNVFAVQHVPLEVDHKMVDVLRNLYRAGMPVNFDYCMYACKDLLQRMQILEERIYVEAGVKFNIGAPAECSHMLFDELKIPTLPDMERGEETKAYPRGVFSTEAEVLEPLYKKYPEYKVLQYLTLYRQLDGVFGKVFAKLVLNCYVDGFGPFTRSQIQYSQTVIPTGRLSSSSNKPKERVVVKENKGGHLSYKYDKGAWTCGMNSQGINTAYLEYVKCKRIKRIPEAAGVDIEQPYSEKVISEFVKKMVAVK